MSEGCGAFNVSVALDMQVAMNVTQAEMLCDLIFDLADCPEVLDILNRDYGGDLYNNSSLPPSLFSMAEKLRQQIKVVKQYRRVRHVNNQNMTG